MISRGGGSGGMLPQEIFAFGLPEIVSGALSGTTFNANFYRHTSSCC